jgi:hypothetical protein
LFKTRCTVCEDVRENRDSPICEGLRGKGWVKWPYTFARFIELFLFLFQTCLSPLAILPWHETCPEQWKTKEYRGLVSPSRGGASFSCDHIISSNECVGSEIRKKNIECFSPGDFLS